MAGENEYLDSKTKDQITQMMQSGMKTIAIRDNVGRIETLYEAPLHADINAPCIRTIYKYFDGAGGTSRKVIAWEEEVTGWPGYGGLPTFAGGDANDIDNLG